MQRMYTLTGREIPESEKTLYSELAKNSRRRNFLYEHGTTEKDLQEYERLEKDAVRMIEKIEKARRSKHYTITTTMQGTIRR